MWQREDLFAGMGGVPLNAQLVISMAGAIALFLYGMSTMTEGLAQLSSGRLERVLEKPVTRRALYFLRPGTTVEV